MISRIPLLIFGVFCCSTAVLMIKASQVGPVMLSALRLFVAAVALSPLFYLDFKKHRAAYTQRHLLLTLLPGAMLALHFIFWLIGARMTPVANSTLIVNFAPVAMPFLLIGAAGEKLTARELLATVIAIGGVSILGASDFSISMTHFWGDIVCFGAMLLFAFYLVLGRRSRSFPSLWLYLVPLYAFASVLCLIAALIVEGLPASFNLRELLLVLGLGLIPTVIGHSILNYSMKHLRGQIVSLLNMGQFIFAGIMAYFLFSEVPHWPYYVASIMIVGGSVLALSQKSTEAKKEETVERLEIASANE